MRTRSRSAAGGVATDESVSFCSCREPVGSASSASGAVLLRCHILQDGVTNESLLSAKLLKYRNNRWAPVQLSDCVFVKRQEKWWLNASAEAQVEVSGAVKNMVEQSKTWPPASTAAKYWLAQSLLMVLNNDRMDLH